MDVEAVIKNYDVQVKEMAYNLSEYDELFKREQRQLSELREHFEKVDEERETINAEEAIVEARRVKLEAEKQRRNEAAALVQAFFRGIVTREQFTVMKKQKKNKKKAG